MFVWLRRFFKKPGQRFVIGETVTHNKIRTSARITKIICDKGQWHYRTVAYCGINKYIDWWEDDEII